MDFRVVPFAAPRRCLRRPRFGAADFARGLAGGVQVGLTQPRQLLGMPMENLQGTMVFTIEDRLTGAKRGEWMGMGELDHC